MPRQPRTAEDQCEHDHNTRENATWYGGDYGHAFYECDGCGNTFSIVV